jgi:hypothetical protein
MSRSRSQPSRRFARDGRGQTIQDFAVGVGLFLVVVATAITLLPPVLAPFDAPITSDQGATAERLGDEVTRGLTINGSDNRLDPPATTDFFSPHVPPTDAADLRARYGLGPGTNVNVTLRTVTGLPNLAVGDRYRDRAVAAEMRIVTDGGDRCRPTCRIVVRVW